MTRLTEEVPFEMAGMRLDQVLAELFTDYSRSKLQSWVKSGRVRVNGLTLKPKDKLEGGETIALDAEAEIVITAEPEPIPLEIVFEDDSILIVNKPAGLVVHPAVGNWNGTLLNALLNHDANLETLPRAGIVHRIDKETSGLLMIAKTLQAHNSLTQQLQDRDITREYLAITRGRMTAGGTVDEPIGRHPTDRKRYAVRENGKHAVTHYRVGQRFTVILWFRLSWKPAAPTRSGCIWRISGFRCWAIRFMADAFKCRPIAVNSWKKNCAVSNGRPCMRQNWVCSTRLPMNILNGNNHCRRI